MPFKKIELVFQKGLLKRVIELLKKAKVPGYTVIDVIAGNGKRSGDVHDNGMISVSSYIYLFTVCSDTEAQAIIKTVQPYIDGIGGKLYLSDVHMFKTENK
jgi:nitrogen regulatory protein PII